MSYKDEIFKDNISKINDFEFSKEVADVFDDMVSRSVPFYHEIGRIMIDLTDRFYQGGPIYDLGCSTGTTLELLSKNFISKGLEVPIMIGIDNSQAMLNKSHEKLAPLRLSNLELREENIIDSSIENSGLVIMNYTLQFIPKEKRAELLKRIYSALKPGGIFLLSEKIHSPLPEVDSMITGLYYDFKKRNGYSDLEIAQKREALENVMTPITPKEQLQQLKNAGFQESEMIFRWYNFASYIAIKT